MPTLADIIQKQVTNAIIDALKNREDELTAIAKAGGKEAGAGFLGDVGSLFSIIHNAVGTALDVAAFAFPPLEIAKALEDAGGKQGRAYGIGYALGYTAYQMLQPALLPISHAVADLAQTEIFDPNTAAKLETQGIITNEYGRSEAAGGNLSGEHYDKLVESAHDVPDLAGLLELWNREAITQADVEAALRHHGFSAEWIAHQLTLRRSLLSPADLALSFLRGEIDETTMRGYAKQLGIDQADMDILVLNTGEPPGPEQLMEALRRGFIDQARFERGIRQSRVRNEWLDVENKLAFSPMSVSDTVRAVVENYLTPDEGLVIARQNGLEPEHWPIMVESWGRPLSHEQMLTLYHRGQASLDDVRQAMRESDIKNKYIDQAIELGRHLVPERTIVSMLDHGVVDHPTASTMLQEQGFNQADADRLIKLGAAQRTSAAKHLTRSDILAMYVDALLNKAEASKHLVSLGYTQDDADTLLSLQDAKAATTARKATIRGIEAAVKANHLTNAQAVAQLVASGLDHAQASNLVDEWHSIKGVATRNLTEAQTIKLAQSGLITPADAMARLQGLGLSAGDAKLWLSYEGVLTGADASQPVIAKGINAPLNP